MILQRQELWKPIPGFSIYEVSDRGFVRNATTGRIMSTSVNNYGHLKISLWDDWGRRRTRSVALMVAMAFCERHDLLCDNVVMLDTDLTNVVAENLVWRPRWFAWQYARQFRIPIRRHYEVLPILNVTQDIEYRSIVECAMTEGLLFNDIWRSTYSADRIYPHFNVYQVLK